MNDRKSKNGFTITYESQIKDSVKTNRVLNKKGKRQYSDFSYRQSDSSTNLIAYGKSKTKHRFNRYAVKFHKSHEQRVHSKKHGQNS